MRTGGDARSVRAPGWLAEWTWIVPVPTPIHKPLLLTWLAIET